MLSEIYNILKNYAFETMVVVCILLLGVLAMCRLGSTGTWGKSYRYVPGISALLRPGKPRLVTQEYASRNTERSSGPPRLSAGEKETRRVLEGLFQRPFPNKRPDFLRNPVTGGTRNLEIDCFCEFMRLGVEYSGIQHYKYTPYMHKSKEAFHNQRYRDELKKRMCKENGVTLIVVPYTVKTKNIEAYLISQLTTAGYLQ